MSDWLIDFPCVLIDCFTVFRWLIDWCNSDQSLVEEQKKERSSSVSILRLLEDTFRMAIMAAFPDLTSPLVLITQSTKSADYQCNSAMQIAGVSHHFDLC